jgi:acetoacetyl-CoA synthetase
MAIAAEGSLLWQPSEERLKNAGLTRYMGWLKTRKGLAFADYHALWQWSVDQVEDFWESIWQYYDIKASSPYTRVLAERKMPGAKWFEGARLNYAEHALRYATPDRPALCFQSEIRPYTEISWEELKSQVAGISNCLKNLGIQPGDRVCAYMPNLPQTAVALLACASVGAVWSSTSPDLGHVSVIDRFKQIAPRVLFAVDGYQYGGKAYDRRAILAEILTHLPSVEKVIFVPYLDPRAEPAGIGNAMLWDEAVNTPGPLAFEQLPFDHPLWVVYSSGTTGMPKPIVHGHGGVVLETLKQGDLSLDVKREDRFFWFSTTNWIMWNLLMNTLMSGTTVLQYDGNPGYPDMSTLWRFADRAKATFFGASAAYIAQCMKAGLHPREVMSEAGIKRISVVGSTGSPLPVEGYQWIYNEVNSDLLLASISGGTDPCAAFVGACPILPQYAGEMQARALGAAIYAYDDAGKPLDDQVGELVCALPMPSFPLYFWNDHDGRRYYESYFDTYPDQNVWRHGDWIKITPRGGAIIYGRSDSTINRHGIRMGSAEIYRVVEDVKEVADSLVVDLEYLGRESYMPLFVVLRPGAILDDALKEHIKQRIRRDLSGRHVPNDVFAIPEVPRTLNGKKLEVPIKRLLLGEPLEKVVNRDSMQNPGSLAWFAEFAARRQAATGKQGVGQAA